MPRLSHASSLPVAALFLATGAWWLASVALQAGTAFMWVPNISASTVYVLVLGQWIIICLFTGRADKSRFSSVIALLGFVVPLWPLLALTWLSSDLRLPTLALTQLLSILIAVVVVFFAWAISGMDIGKEHRRHLRTSFGIFAAAVIWSQRYALHAWLLQ